MRPVTINVHDPRTALEEIQRASHEADLTEIAQNFSSTGTLTETFAVNLSSPTAANVAAVLATLIAVLQRGGPNRTT